MTTLEVLAPVFGIMGLGFVAARARVLDEAGVRGLVLFVFNFAIPVLLFRSIGGIRLPDDVRWGFLVAFYSGSLACYLLGMASARALFRRPLDHQAIFGMGAAFSNTVLLGIPVVLTAFGPEATLPLFLIIAFHSAVFAPLTVGLIQAGQGQGVSAGQQARRVVLEVVRNPIVLGLGAGLVANLTGLVLPPALDRGAELLGAAAVPCALFAMGSSLGIQPLVGDVPPALVLSTLKLVIHPLLVWVVAVPVLGLGGLWSAVAVTMAAMPSGVNVYLFAARYEAASGVAARTVLVTSALSVVTLAVVLALVGP